MTNTFQSAAIRRHRAELNASTLEATPTPENNASDALPSVASAEHPEDFSWLGALESLASMSLIFALAGATLWANNNHNTAELAAQTELIVSSKQYTRFTPVDFKISGQNNRIKVATKETYTLNSTETILNKACTAEVDDYLIATVEYKDSTPKVVIEQRHEDEATLLIQDPTLLYTVQTATKSQI